MRKILILCTFLFCLNNLFAQSNFIHQDTVFGRTANCSIGVPVCIDSIVYDNISNLRFFLDGQQFNGSVKPCNIDTVIQYSYYDIFRNNAIAPWQLRTWTVNTLTFTGYFDNLATLVDSMRLWDSSGDWHLDSIYKSIYGFSKNSVQYGCQEIVNRSNNQYGVSQVCYNTGITARGLQLSVPSGIHQLIVEKTSTGQRDTVTVVAACMSSDTIRKEVVIHSSQYYCFDANRLPGRAGQLYNVCNSTSAEPLFNAPSNGCIRYLGRRLGSDTACLMMCDDLGNCATTTLIVTTKYTYGRGIIVRDTISVGSSRDITNSLMMPIGNVFDIRYDDERSFGSSVAFDINQTAKTVSMTGLTTGVDTAYIIACSTIGYCDTTLLSISAITPQSPCLHDTIKPIFQNCPANISVSTSSTATTAEWTIPTATDNCSTPSVSSNFNSGVSFPLGTTAVIYTAADSSGNTATCAFNIIVTPKPLVIDTTKRYILVARSSQQALSIRNSSTSLAADAVQSNYTGGLNQQWAIKNADIDAFTLSVQHTNRNLETRWGTTRSGSRLMQWTGNSTSSTQKWLLIPLGNGYYKIISKASGRALSVNGGVTANVNNTYLVQLNYEGLASQQWRIEVAP